MIMRRILAILTGTLVFAALLWLALSTFLLLPASGAPATLLIIAAALTGLRLLLNYRTEPTS